MPPNFKWFQWILHENLSIPQLCPSAATFPSRWPIVVVSCEFHNQMSKHQTRRHQSHLLFVADEIQTWHKDHKIIAVSHERRAGWFWNVSKSADFCSFHLFPQFHRHKIPENVARSLSMFSKKLLLNQAFWLQQSSKSWRDRLKKTCKLVQKKRTRPFSQLCSVNLFVCLLCFSLHLLKTLRCLRKHPERREQMERKSYTVYRERQRWQLSGYK